MKKVIEARESITHKLKCGPNFMDDLIAGKKTFEIRVNDRDYRIGDVLALQEFDPNKCRYLTRKLTLLVTYIMKGSPGNPCLKENACVMSVAKM